MRIEKHHGRWIVCGYVFPKEFIKKGQIWQGSSGSTVEVLEVDDGGEVYYSQSSGSPDHSKDYFSFQCRYCKVVDVIGV